MQQMQHRKESNSTDAEDLLLLREKQQRAECITWMFVLLEMKHP